MLSPSLDLVSVEHSLSVDLMIINMIGTGLGITLDGKCNCSVVATLWTRGDYETLPKYALVFMHLSRGIQNENERLQKTHKYV